MENRAVYPIGVVSELLNIHPETIRVWERYGVIRPARRGRRRYYSENDIRRLQFIQRLIREGLNLPAARYHLRFYPCWHLPDACPSCMHRTDRIGCAKPCWKAEGTYCMVSASEDMCASCQFSKKDEQIKGLNTTRKLDRKEVKGKGKIL